MTTYSDFVDQCRMVGMELVGAAPKETVYIESPNPDAILHQPSDPVIVQPSGILLQRCGGGHRILRKRVGSH